MAQAGGAGTAGRGGQSRPAALAQPSPGAAESEAQRADRTFRSLLDAAPDAMVYVDAQGRIAMVNAEAERAFGYSRDQLVGQPVEILIPDGLREGHVGSREAYMAHPRPRLIGNGGCIVARRRDGTEYPADISLRPIETEAGLLVCAAVRDVSERVEALALYRLLTENASDVIGTSTRHGRLTYLSPACRTLLGWEPAEMVGRGCYEYVHPEDRPLALGCLNRAVEQPPRPATAEVRLRRRDGTHLWTEVTGKAIADPVGGEVREIQFSIRDISGRRQAQADIERQAMTDPLTGLANRAVLLDRLGVALHRLARTGGHVALVLLDLDHFKAINDSVGHLIGDEVLRTAGLRLRGVARPSDTVARLGGDEFAVMADGLPGAGDARALAARLVAACRQPQQVEDGEVVVSASAGVVVAGATGRRPEDLLREADLALYRAKDRGRDRFEVFDAALQARVTARMRVERTLREALGEGRLRLEYQPLVDLATGAVVEAEALLRVEAAGHRLLLPHSFLEVAAECGLLTRLGEWAQAAAISQLVAWTSSADTAGLGRVALNVTVRDLADPHYGARLIDRMARSGLDGGSLAVEVTEEALLAGTPAALATLHQLHRGGVRLGLDDFGSGFSSLAHLQRFPLDFVKVDRAVIRQVGADGRTTAVVEAVIRLAHALDLEVVAEGVETELQRSALRALDCDRAQGFLFSPSLPAGELGRLLQSGRRW